MTMIDITNVVNVSVLVPPAGLAPYSLNNLVCFTRDTPSSPTLTAFTGDFAAYASPSEVAADWGSNSNVYAAAVQVFAQSPNILSGGGLFIVAPLESSGTAFVEGGPLGTITWETLDDALARLIPLVYFGGFSYDYTLGTGEAAATALVAESERKLFFVSSSTEADLTADLFYDVKSASQTHTRCLFHNDADETFNLRWAYAGRAMSTNFSGNSTASTMHLKSLANVLADTDMTQTILGECSTVGADAYVNIAGQSCVMSYGANGFFDDVYNLEWILGALEVAGFNYLRMTGTKVPQTESGMDGLKGAYRAVCRQAVGNGFVAPGAWTGSDTFGVPEDFNRNIADFGFYIYSQPVALQATADRLLRKAPVIQIALKYAGAIHSSNVIVNINK